ncbi:MAG: hypothetical protein AMXMBFR64_36750 [Myxococcales bacterium]
MSRVTARALVAVALVGTLVACQKAGERPIEYEYVYKGTPQAVAVTGAGAPLSLAAAPSMGPANAKVTIVESSDFECPFCGKVWPTMDQLKAEYPNDVRIVFVHNPLGFHQKAMPAAKASMAAHKQGKFWEYGRLLFERKNLSEESYVAYAQELGLDLARFNADRASQEIQDLILHNQKAVVTLGAGGTPAFFINGKKLSGAQPYPAFKTEVDAALAAANAELAKGTKQEDLHRVLAGRNAGQSFVDWIIDGKPVTGSAQVAQGGDRGGRGERPAQPPQPTGPVDVPVEDDDPVHGKADAPVTIVLFSDFECPFCSRIGPTYKQIEETYGDKVRFVFKQQPLPFHKKAQLAAEASLAANAQGKFWEYHDLLFANQKALERPDLERYAEQLGLDMAKFRAALDSNQFAEAVKKDQALASKVGATGTPASFINGIKVNGAQPFPAFQAVIDKALAGGPAVAAPPRRDGAGLAAPVTGLSADGPALGPDKAKDLAIAFVDLGNAESLQAVSSLLALQESNGGTMRLLVRHAQSVDGRRASPVGQMLVAALRKDAPKAWVALAAIAKGADPSLRTVTDAFQKAGLDPADLRGAMRDQAVLDALRADAAEARKAGVATPPGVVLNGRPYLGGKGWDKATLEGLLKESRGR